MKKYDVIVIGAGHAGVEAALSSSRMGCKVLLITMSKKNIASTPCNPSIGGVGKGQLVKEIDALGGEMAKAADTTGIHFRILNRSRGPAVWSSRAQIDRHKYAEYMQDKILSQDNLDLLEDEVIDILKVDDKAVGVKTKSQESYKATSIVITPGTFLNGLIHIGLKHHSGGCFGEPAATELSKSLKSSGFDINTLKTGTTPRIKKDSIDFDILKPQPGDNEPMPFSFSKETKPENKVLCHITYTNPTTHSIISNNLDKSPLYSGKIKSTGVRYCPSIEDKIVKFANRDRHQIFLEPEGLDTDWYYPNGISTSLPLKVQNDMLHSIEGLKHAEIIQPGYGIEYEFIQPTELYPTLETKKIKNLFLAGQVNGTTGYEEAAAQGLIAGINAALTSKDKEPLILPRTSSYIGVLVDDLTTKGTKEPYRMFTSRVEYRLMIREDNADLRLREYGYRIGLISESEYDQSQRKRDLIENSIKKLKGTQITPTPKTVGILENLTGAGLSKAISAADILRRPELHYEDMKTLGINLPNMPLEYTKAIELIVKYDGFIKRQLADIKRMENIEKIRIPKSMDFTSISGLSREIIEKLEKIKPVSLGQASRISGITPAAITLLMVYLKRQ